MTVKSRSPSHRRRITARTALSVLGRGKLAMVLALGVTGAFTASVLTAAAASAPAQADKGGAGSRIVAAGGYDSAGQKLINQGKQTFRFDTFGDQKFWGDTLHLHQAIAGAANGGVGPGVSPRTALAVGLKVDSTALPNAVKQGILNGS